METQKQFKRRFSFEFFPPKTEEGKAKLQIVRDELARRKPDFFSVTYGAGGGTRERTHELLTNIKKQTELEVVSHLTCVGHTNEELLTILKRYDETGIQILFLYCENEPVLYFLDSIRSFH